MGGFLILVGILAFLIGVISLIKPLKFLRITTRKMGAFVLLAGFVIFIVGASSLPPPEEEPTAIPEEEAVEEPEPEDEVVDEVEPEYQMLSGWSYDEVEEKLEKKDMTLNIDQINVFLENENIELEKNSLRNGYYEFFYDKGEMGEEDFEEIVAFGTENNIKWLRVQKNFDIESVRQFEEAMKFMVFFIHDTFYDWEEGRQWFLDNLEHNEITRTYFEHKNEYIEMMAFLSTYTEPGRVFLVFRSAE